MADYFPHFPIGRKLKARGIHPDGNEHDSLLWDMMSAHGGAKRLREEFKVALAETEKRFKLGYLGDLGLKDEKEKIIEEHTEKLDKFRSAESAARKAEQQYRAELTAPKKVKSADADEAVEAAFRRHRAITRFEALPPDKRREALRGALEKKDRNFLSILLSEPALIDAESARRIEIELMKAGDREKFDQLQELVGLYDYDGKADPLQGALPVLSYVLDSTRDFFLKQAGLDAEPPAPKIEDGAAILSPEEAKDPSAYRAARDAAAEEGLELKVVEE